LRLPRLGDLHQSLSDSGRDSIASSTTDYHSVRSKENDESDVSIFFGSNTLLNFRSFL
jgi:hypothetical protein